MEQLFVLTHGYAVLRETEETGPIISRPAFKRCFLFAKLKKKRIFFWQHDTLTQGVFATQLSSNARISVWRIVGYDKVPLRERYVILRHVSRNHS